MDENITINTTATGSSGPGGFLRALDSFFASFNRLDLGQDI